VAKKVVESDEIVSFYLRPRDGGALPAFQAGQFVSVRAFVPEMGVYQPRQYSLSDAPDGKHFRISVKREGATATGPAGRISNVLHQLLPEGAELDLSNPYGDFTLDLHKDSPVVLISGGVGITPLMAMLSNIVAYSNSTNKSNDSKKGEERKKRRVVFVHAVRNGKVHALKSQLAELMAKDPEVERAIFYEEVGENDLLGVDYDYRGRIDLDKIRNQVLLPDADYYLCGPVPFMRAERRGLEQLGAEAARIHSEVFGAGDGME